VDEAVESENQFEIRAGSGRAEGRTKILKRGETFALFDRFGDINAAFLPELGLYHEGTRFLSGLALTLDGCRPLLLGSHVRDDNSVLIAELTNGDLNSSERPGIGRGTLHLAREIRVFPGGCTQVLRVRNFGLEPLAYRIAMRVASDFADVFEVRGTPRSRRGRLLPPMPEKRGVVLSYSGLDGVFRQTQVLCDPEPTETRDGEIAVRQELKPGQRARLVLTVFCDASREGVSPPAERRVFSSAAGARNLCRVSSSQEAFDDWIARSAADLQMMITETPWGLYPYAGVPWFSTPFGRDGIITALQVLWALPELARGVLSYLAATQATELSPERDAEPGKILHEARLGEMAALGEVPFGRYYGSVDATPLFVILAAAYFERTGDREFLESLWPHVERALAWIDAWGDLDGDGFVEYYRRSPDGLVHQGWKDSRDGIFHRDGSFAEGPIALCEVQGYVYAAKRGAAQLAARRGDEAKSGALLRQAAALSEQFDRAFWCEDIGTYALALDGAKKPCAVRTSNAGHALWTGIARGPRARRLASSLFSAASFSGWGVRTVASGEARYNPMSYHNGSVWPHDNAVLAAGLARYGAKSHSSALLECFFDLSRALELRRMPELICGFGRRPGDGPVLYPYACAPQSWSAGAVYLMLQSCLGLSIRATERRIAFENPVLPRFLESVRLEELRIGANSVDLVVHRQEGDVAVEVARRDGEIEVVVAK
jgi:glycogen debranching enzyme